MPPASSKNFLKSILKPIYFIILLSFAKIALIAPFEITTEYTDAVVYAQGGLKFFWSFDHFDRYLACRQPVYYLFVYFNSFTGIPLRLSVEFLFLLGCYAMYVGMGRLGVKPFFAVLAFALGAFFPGTFGGFDRLMSDTLYTLLMTLGCGLGLILVATVRHLEQTGTLTLKRILASPVSWGFGVVMALAYNTRPEHVYVAVAVLGIGLIAAWQMAQTKLRFAAILGLTVMAPLISIFTVTSAIKLANYTVYGYYLTFDLESPGYEAIQRSILRIRSEQAIPYAPFMKDAREKAYAASPCFKQFEPGLEGRALRDLEPSAYADTQVKGHFGTWLNWAIMSAIGSVREEQARAAGKTGPVLDDYADMEQIYLQCSAEIDKALEDGRLPSRPSFYPFYRGFWAGIPQDAWKFFKVYVGDMARPTAVHRHIITDETVAAQAKRPEIEELFNQAALRRTWLLTPKGGGPDAHPINDGIAAIYTGVAARLTTWGTLIGIATLILLLGHLIRNRRPAAMSYAPFHIVLFLGGMVLARLILMTAVAVLVFGHNDHRYVELVGPLYQFCLPVWLQLFHSAIMAWRKRT
ncbi:hypothetical protein [Nitrospirillum sp. BR 11163]|uniref:hypothetical protein n=1 Tax=Nitrospirillum sp. BR 11163 TaxID=3104323 RepID=UPI002AFFB007|nr:hypothetical protein [Nitrospirillum sp. BR 11163]MEA1672495.1 hypothetical protein [Nitrospirillum sp. BR 11163]